MPKPEQQTRDTLMLPARLRAGAQMMRNTGGMFPSTDLAEDAAKEIERLRAALNTLQTLGEQGMKPDPNEWLTFHDKVAKIAKDALR